MTLDEFVEFVKSHDSEAGKYNIKLEKFELENKINSDYRIMKVSMTWDNKPCKVTFHGGQNWGLHRTSGPATINYRQGKVFSQYHYLNGAKVSARVHATNLKAVQAQQVLHTQAEISLEV